MNAGSSSVVPRLSRRPLSAGLGVSLVLLALAVPTTAGFAAAEEPVTAVWKARQLHFSYRGYEAVYPCSVLQQRIALVLNAVGARPDLEVIVNDCDGPFASATVPLGDGAYWPPGATEPAAGDPLALPAGRDLGWTRTAASGRNTYRRSEPRQVANATIRLSVPVETTPEVIAELETDRKRRELITRVTGNPLPLFDDPIPFPATRQVVTLSRETAGVDAADCELLEQMATRLFRELGIRVVRRGYTCDRSYASRVAPTLDVEALVPVGFEVGGKEEPAPGGKEADPRAPEDTGDPSQ